MTSVQADVEPAINPDVQTRGSRFYVNSMCTIGIHWRPLKDRIHIAPIFTIVYVYYEL
jgi:hypothetical protein